MNRFSHVLVRAVSSARVSKGLFSAYFGSNSTHSCVNQATYATNPSVYAPGQGIICPLPAYFDRWGGWGGTPLDFLETIRAEKNFLFLNSDESTL